MEISELFRDARFVVLDKPAGLKVHPGPGGGPSVEDAFALLSKRKDGPWLAHRLDADTAGCLVVALRKAALIAAQGEFAAGRARKTYWAVVAGGPAEDSGTIDLPLRKVTSQAGWRMEGHASGDPAVTDWTVLGRGAGMALLELRPRTGRTHQIRVHCAAQGWPILGDPIYGSPIDGSGGGGLHLLARAIHLALDPPVDAIAPVPPHMRAAVAACQGVAP
jgi:RluA family pseudouridine synthase